MEQVGQPLLDVQNVSVIFPDDNGGLHTLENISFQVAAQEFICIIGPSGCGKTTLLRTLGGFLTPTSGNVLLRGDALGGPSAEIGFVFQNANLMPWRTVISNILLPLEIKGTPNGTARQKALELIDLVGLAGFEEYFPRQLSGGMAQRVAIARALIYDAEMLLLDEPFGALDAITRQRMCSELLRIWSARRKTMIMVTHSISDAIFLADRVFVMSPRPGKICLEQEIALPRPRSADIRFSVEFSQIARVLQAAIA